MLLLLALLRPKQDHHTPFARSQKHQNITVAAVAVAVVLMPRNLILASSDKRTNLGAVVDGVLSGRLTQRHPATITTPRAG